MPLEGWHEPKCQRQYNVEDEYNKSYYLHEGGEGSVKWKKNSVNKTDTNVKKQANTQSRWLTIRLE